MNSWRSYPSIYNLVHSAIKNLFTVSVLVEEKIDGSQFSFGKDANGDLHIRSKGAVTYIDAPEKMFAEISRGITAGFPEWYFEVEGDTI